MYGNFLQKKNALIELMKKGKIIMEVKEYNENYTQRNIVQNNAQNTDYEYNNEINNRKEKKCIIYLIVLVLILVYVTFFFIHNIIDRSQIKDVISGTIDNPSGNVTDDGNTNNGQGNNNLVTGNNQGNNTTTSPGVVDNSDRFKVKQGDTEFNELKELDIFRNSYFKNSSIIAPGVQGTYSFTIENDSESKFTYEVFYQETNNYNINMVYKIKVNDTYVIGDESTWVTHDDFIISNRAISPYTTDLYTVEWKWEDANNDTEIGMTDGANYKLNVRINATQIVE